LLGSVQAATVSAITTPTSTSCTAEAIVAAGAIT
jgi:hypothetical protein